MTVAATVEIDGQIAALKSRVEDLKGRVAGYVAKKQIIESAIVEANELFGTDFRLVGSWATKGHSDKDVDLVTDQSFSPDLDASSLYILYKTEMVVDIFPSWLTTEDDYGHNYGYLTDGTRHGVPVLKKFVLADVSELVP